MLDPWIIEEIRRREREERRYRDERPVLEIPMERPAHPSAPANHIDGGEPSVGDRGIAILDYRI